MKHLSSYRAIVTIAMMLIGWLQSLAHDFEVDGVFYNKTSDNTVAVTYKGDSYSSYSKEYIGDVVIPSSVNYNGTTYSVTSIGDDAFHSCYSLTSIEIPNSVTSIGDYAFVACESLISIEIPNSVTSIGDWAFQFCTSLTSIEIPNSVTSIGDNAFTMCLSLTSVVIGNSVTSIGVGAFSSCSSLTSVVIGNSVTSIGNWAFSNCTCLDGIEIPNSVTSIGDYAFQSCRSLTKITCLATTPPTIESDTFSEYSADLYVPVGCISAYQSAIFWKKFNIKEIPTFATSIALNKTSASLKAAETLTLVATVLPENATDKTVTWTSSNEAVATVDANGKVTAVAVGEAVITATTTDGSNLQAKCKITVVDPNADQPSETNYMLIPETEAFCGTSIKLPIELVNEDEIISFQCDLYLPDGITITDVDGKYDITLNNSRNSDFMLNYNKLSDGTLRIIGISFTSTPIKGNSGELINIGLDISSDCSGEYTIEVKDIIMSDINGKEIVASDIIGTLNVIDYILGDANGDGKVNIVDASAVINYVLGKSPAKFVIKAADVNGSGSVNIADASGIINIVLGKATTNAPAVLNSNSLDDCLIGEGVDVNKLSLALVNNNQFTSFQFDLKVENNVELKNILPSVRLADSHKIFFNKISDQTYRIACVSMSNETIDGECSNLMDLIFENSDNTRIEIDNIIFSTPNAVEYLMESIAADMPETNSIDNVYAQTDIYIKGKSVVVESPCDCVTSITSLTGVVQRMETSVGINFYNLESGFYIVSSNNITKKIIIK